MKDLLRKIVHFIAFDFALDADCLARQFGATHLSYQKDIPHWSSNSTRQKIVVRYWYELVLSHFTFVFAISVLLFLVIFNTARITLPVVFLAGIVVYSIMLLFHYRPGFYSEFLPKLDTIKENFERKQLEQLEKCKKAQLSNPALVLIYYVFDKISGINSLQCNDRYAALLVKLFGVDQGSLKKNLELIFGKKKNLTERRYTEIHNRFDEAKNFFADINCKEGVRILNDLEQKFKAN
jgi:hypothetical protein